MAIGNPFLFLAFLPFISVTSGQWNNPWIKPQTGSNFNLTVQDPIATAYIRETIDLNSNCMFLLSYSGSSNPTLSDLTYFRFENNAVNGPCLVLIQKLDYETDPVFQLSLTLTVSGTPSRKQLFVTVVDENDNDPIFIGAPTRVTYAENQPKGGLIAEFTATDRDAGDNAQLIYSFRTIIGEEKYFELKSITSSGGNKAQLIAKDMFDFETDPFFVLEITAQDRPSGGRNSSMQLSVQIEDVGDNPPVWFRQSPLVHVREDTKPNTLIFTVEAKDGDTGIRNKITYQIDDATKTFSIDSNSGEVRLLTSVDRDTLDIPFFQVTITATEVGDNAASDTTSTIFIDDVNDNNPMFLNSQYTAQVEEGFSGRITFESGDIYVNDPDLANAGTYTVSITNSTNGITLNPAIGRQNASFYVSIPFSFLDYEDPKKRSYTFQLLAQEEEDESHTDTCIIRIEAKDVNDNAPKFTNKNTTSGYQVQIIENASKGTLVNQIIADDEDISAEFGKESIRYSFVETGDESASNYLSINEVTGDVTVANNDVFDRETINRFFFSVQASDMNNDGAGKKTTASYNVEILDFNDNAPEFLEAGPFKLVENANVSFTIGVVQARDADAVYNKIAYSIKRCDGSGLEYIGINASNGKLFVNKVPDYEEIQNLHCILAATDNGIPPLVTNADLDIEIIDQNDNDPVFVVFPTGPIHIPEIPNDSSLTELGGSVNGTLIATIKASDRDSGSFGTVNYTFGRSNTQGEDQFEINLATGEIRISLRNGAKLDYEITPSIQFKVEARDDYRESILGGSRYVEGTITVDLEDINDNAPELPDSPSGCFGSTAEDATQDQIIVRINGIDKDEPGKPNSQITYTLGQQTAIPPTPPLPGDLPIFSIETNSNVGELKVKPGNLTGFKGNYTVVVMAKDGGQPQQGTTETYTICIEDYNDHRPKFVFPPTPEGYTVNCLETSPTNNRLTCNTTEWNAIPLEIFATDEDEGENAKVSYHTSGVWDDQLFQLDIISDRAYIKLISNFNRTLQNKHTLFIEARDNGSPRLSSVASITILVRRAQDFPPEFSPTQQSFQIYENDADATMKFSSATDKNNDNLLENEDPDPIYYSIVGGNKIDFEIPNPLENVITLTKALDREKLPDVLYILIHASNDPPSSSPIDTVDQQNGILNVTVEVLDVNDCPPVFPSSLAGGITFGNKKDAKILSLLVSDPDQDDSAIFLITSGFNASDPSIIGVANNSFRIDGRDILLNFEVQKEMKGFFLFNVTATDKGSNKATSPVKIYIVTDENKVTYLFGNIAAAIEQKRSEVEATFSDVYSYRCIIESISEDQKDQNTSVIVHFVDEIKDEPVPNSVIFGFTNNITVGNELKYRFAKINLTLISVSNNAVPGPAADQLFLYLFILACVVLGVLLIVLGIVCGRGRRIERKLKVEVAAKRHQFGSQDSGLNRTGAIPNTNRHFAEGSNPMYNIEDDIHDDNISTSSGGSSLIGIEENQDFKNVSRANTAPLPFQNVVRKNPLADLEGTGHTSQDTVASKSVKRPAPPIPVGDTNGRVNHDYGEDTLYDNEHEIENGVIDEQLNSNFHLGTKSMTSF